MGADRMTNDESGVATEQWIVWYRGWARMWMCRVKAVWLLSCEWSVPCREWQHRAAVADLLSLPHATEPSL